MQNLSRSAQRYVFSVNGGDLRSTRVALIWPALILILPQALYFALGREHVPPSAAVYGYPACLLLSLIVVWRVFGALNRGVFTRFEIGIDLDAGLISVYDRLDLLRVWEEEFDPDNLYVSRIQVIIQGELYTYPALVYGNEPQEVVEESVPYPDRSLLGFGEEAVVGQIHSEIRERAIEMGL